MRVVVMKAAQYRTRLRAGFGSSDQAEKQRRMERSIRRCP